MNGHRFSLLLGALAFAAALQPQAAQAQFDTPYCMVSSEGYVFNLSVDESSDVIGGTTDVFDDELWAAGGARGTTNRTIRHHSFTFTNPDYDDSSDCTDGAFFVDWVVYNGLIAPAGGGTFNYNVVALNSCGGEFSGITATITPGPCRVAGTGAPAPGASIFATSRAPADEAAARVSPEGYGVTSRPNPFDNGTTLTYSIPEASDVRLIVYDALGREVAVLVDGAVAAGAHRVAFDASSLPAGTYLYRMTAGTHVESGHMAVVR